MIIGMLSDAHGNVEGFLAGVRLLRRLDAEEIHFLGDAVGYLPGAGVVQAIVAEGIEAIAGNHEAMLLGADEGVDDDVFRFAETRHALGAAGMSRVADWPSRRVLATGVGPVLLVHDSPFGGGRYVYPDTELGEFDRFPYPIVCMGHTHRPFVRRHAGTTFVNVGSCGLPRDDGSLGAVATLDSDTGEVRIVRFDLTEANRAALERVGQVHRLVHRTMARRERPHESARDASFPILTGVHDA